MLNTVGHCITVSSLSKKWTRTGKPGTMGLLQFQQLRLHVYILGVEEVEVEMKIQKITVRGFALEEKKVRKAIKRVGKAAEPWPLPGYSHFASFYKYPTYIVNHYYDSYKSEGSNRVHTFFHTPAVYYVALASDVAVASLFSDDNPRACSIM
ncbi:hypothetical protein CRYUN_Cryun07bG0101900 [Craigia yunnanensis]